MKYVVFFISCLFCFASITYAQTSFPALLEEKGIDINEIYNSDTVTRETVAELLNVVDCQDCHRPSTNTVKSLTQSWWNTFRQYPGKNFDDVAYNSSLQADNNYYCIAYVGNQGYMNGYPRSTSPFCSGKFCGSLPITNADLIQTVFNTSAKAFYAEYKANWSAIASRFPQQATYIKNYFTLQDLGIINASKALCTSGSCTLRSEEALNVYAKYCTFEPEECGMKELSFAKKGQWPLAEMNILRNKGIFTQQELEKINIENYASGEFVLEVLGRVKPLVQCQDTNDQDQDGILDYDDNAYLIYNPSQRDTDKDGIGDVEDDDIDNDGIKNPKGAVDENGNIVYEAHKDFTGKNDNCIFTPNNDQKDDDKNNVGNVCDNNDPIGLRMETKQLTQSRYALIAQYSGNFKEFVRYFGDKTTGSGEITTHTYANPGQYIVRVEGTTVKGQVATAYGTITIGGARATLTPEYLVQSVGQRVLYTIQLQGVASKDVEYVDIQRGDGRTRQLRGSEVTSFLDAYAQQGGYAIYGTVHTNDGQLLPIGAYVTVKGGYFCMPYSEGNWNGHCDMNKNTIPDMCDTDIDGDGVENPLGLIRYEKKDCSYDAENTNTYTGYNSTGIIIYTGIIRDNCPFVSNPEQKDCKPLIGPEKDTDGDGIPDGRDKCPTVPETINGVNDDDGCPEYDVLFSFPGTKLQAGSCNTCPCQYAQNDSSLAPGDRVKAVLYNSTTNRAVTESNWYTVQ